MTAIKLKCSCGKIHDVIRTSEIPTEVVSMECNWCPDCEDTADDYYNEWYIYDENQSTSQCQNK